MVGLYCIQVMKNGNRTLPHVRGVGMVLNRQATKALIGWKPVSDRIITASPGENYNSGTEDANDDVNDAFYEQLEDTINDTPCHDVKLLMGDFSAQIDCNRQG